MPYHRPIPDSNPRGKGSVLVNSIVQAEKMIQIALVPPCAGFIGWLGGVGLDKLLHTHWIATAGVVFGILAGLIGAVKLTITMAGGQGTEKDDVESEDKE
jgi:hypothetical protein